MSLAIEVDNRSGCELDLKALTALSRRVLASLGLDAGELGLALVDEAEMANLNQGFMGKEGPTDVLSFPMDALEGGQAWEGQEGEAPPPMLGDVVICPQVAEKQAAGLGWTLEQELCLLLIHGLLHLAGFDHESDDGAMEARQEELFREFC